jgi:hypothetical protein
MEMRPDGMSQNKGFQALCMTQRVIAELERQSRQCRESLDGVLAPEIERLDALQRASERLMLEEPERWQRLADLYGEIGDLLRGQATELEEEISIHEALIGALKEDLWELESAAFGSGAIRPEP